MTQLAIWTGVHARSAPRARNTDVSWEFARIHIRASPAHIVSAPRSTQVPTFRSADISAHRCRGRSPNRGHTRCEIVPRGKNPHRSVVGSTNGDETAIRTPFMADVQIAPPHSQDTLGFQKRRSKQCFAEQTTVLLTFDARHRKHGASAHRPPSRAFPLKIIVFTNTSAIPPCRRTAFKTATTVFAPAPTTTKKSKHPSTQQDTRR